VAESGTTVTHKTHIGGAAVVIETTLAPASSERLAQPSPVALAK
jgi:hypothetical protein